jgi:hypothetical protein
MFAASLLITIRQFASGGRKFVNVSSRVARWCVFKPKLPIWVNFRGSWTRKCWYILWPIGIYFGTLVNFIGICKFSGNLIYFFCFGTFFQEKSGNPGLALTPMNASIYYRDQSSTFQQKKKRERDVEIGNCRKKWKTAVSAIWLQSVFTGLNVIKSNSA